MKDFEQVMDQCETDLYFNPNMFEGLNMFNMIHEIYEGELMRKIKHNDNEIKSAREIDVPLSGDKEISVHSDKKLHHRDTQHKVKDMEAFFKEWYDLNDHSLHDVTLLLWMWIIFM